MMPLRKAVFWVHLVCGVTTGLVVLVMSVTGVVLTYQKQMTQWSDREYWVEPAVEGQRAPLSSVVEAARAYDPDASVGSVVVHSDPVAPVAASLGGGRTLYLDPSTATVRGENTTAMRSFFSWNMRVHRWFGVSGEARSTARAITGWSNLAFLFLILSGLYLWIPKRISWQHFRPILVLNTAARGKARDFNWHHVFGFWTAIPLAVVVASATVISFPWASDLAYRVVGDEPPQRASTVRPPAPVPTSGTSAVLASPGAGASELVPEEPEPVPFELSKLDPLIVPAMNRLDEWRIITVTVPEEAGAPVQMRIDEGWGGEPQKRHTVRYDSETGAETSYATFADQSRGRRFRTFLRFAHTGEYFGFWGQTIAGIVTLLSVLLVWSGFALAWRRLVVPALRRRVAEPA